MRIAYLDCFAGISGDMFLGALLGAGVPVQVMQEAAGCLKIGASLRVETVDRSGISSVKVHVLEHGAVAEGGAAADPMRDQQALGGAGMQKAPETQHQHKGGHAHTHTHEDSAPKAGAAEEPHEHAHGHEHGRSLSVITQMIAESSLDAEVKATATKIFGLLGYSEAKIHNVPVERIHFHEVGAVDAIVDIVCASAGIHFLAADRWFCSPVNVGGGMVDCAHGRFPVPAPATADLLRGMPTYSANLQKELVTPTGAAILKALEPEFGQQPAMRVEAIGYGAGTRNPEGFPNVLRLSVGEGDVAASGKEKGTVLVMETALDDLSPQVIAYVTETALTLGALDVMTSAVQMKKNRLGTLITILTDEEHAGALEDLLLRETSTLGVRIRSERRVTLDRAHVAVATEYGEIRVKTGSRDGEELNAAPEWEDCRAAAVEHRVPAKRVMQAAAAAYANRTA